MKGGNDRNLEQSLEKTEVRDDDSLYTTVPANLLRNRLTSVFHMKASTQCHIHSCSIPILFTLWCEFLLCSHARGLLHQCKVGCLWGLASF